MSMLPTNAAQVQQFAAAMYNVTVGSRTMAQVNADIASTPNGLDGVLNKYFTASFGTMTTANVASTIVSNLGITGDAAKVAATYVEARLNEVGAATRGSKITELLNLFSGLKADKDFGVFATAWGTRVQQAVEYAANGQADLIGRPSGSSGAGNEMSLGQDNLIGGSADDLFIGRIINNANTLQSADKVSGGSGFDTIFADMGSSQNFAVTPETTGVEAIKIRGQSRAVDTADNNIVSSGMVGEVPTPGKDGSTNGLVGSRVVVDAERMTGLTHIESNNSRADVIVEDVRINAAQITKDVTIAMVQTDPGNVDFGVYFDQPSLRASTSSQSQLQLQLMDTRYGDTPTPLKDSPYDSLTFTYSGKVITLKSEAINNAQTYAELTSALQGAVAANADLTGVTVTLGGSFNATDTRTGIVKSGTAITLKGSGTFSIPAGSGWAASAPVPPDSGFHTFMQTDASSSTDLVTSKVILDHVGRGSNGGDLVIGGLSVGETSTSRGVDRFEITVERDSRLQTVNSTNNWLKEVVISNGTTKGTLSVLGTDVVPQNSAHVSTDELPGLTQPLGQAGVDPTTATRTQHNTHGFTDVRLIDASAMVGAVSLDAELSNNFRAKFITDTDQAPAQPGDDNVSVTGTTVQRQDVRYSGGAGNDTMTVVIDSANFTANTGNTVLASREDFSFNLSGNAGNDSLRVSVNQDGTGPANWYQNQKLLSTAGMIGVQGGEGNDTIRTPGHGDFRISDGPGNDTVYSDNSGTISTRWDVNTKPASSTSTNVLSDANSLGFVWKPQVRVTFSGPQLNSLGGLTGEGSGDDASALSNGFESAWVDVPQTAATLATTRLQLIQAIKAAVNSDAVLGKVLSAADGPANSLFISSLIDGKFDEDDFRIDFKGGTPAATDEAELVRLYQAFSGNSKATLADAVTAHTATVNAANGLSGMSVNQVLGIDSGAVSVAQTDKRIDIGSGDDVYVLSTSINSAESLVFSGYSLGKKTIINFSDATSFPATPADRVDSLNFASYLTSKISSSGSELSASTAPITISTTGGPSVEANEVIVMNGVSFTTTKTFAGLDAAAVLAAINSSNVSGANDYGSLNAASLDANNSYIGSGAGSLVGGTGKAVVLIENAGNLGEYKAFELTFDGTSANTKRDFSDVKWIATIDLGDSWGTVGVSPPSGGGGDSGGGGSGGGGSGGGTTPVPATRSISITGAGSSTEPAATNTTYTVAKPGSSYTFSIAGFSQGDKIIGPAGVSGTVADQSSFTDGSLSIQYADSGNTVKVTLTGLTNAQDSAIFGVADLNTVFGPGTFA